MVLVALGKAVLNLVAAEHIAVDTLQEVVFFEHIECSAVPAVEFQDVVAQPVEQDIGAEVLYILQYDVQRGQTFSPWKASGCPTKANGIGHKHADFRYADSISTHILDS